MSIELYRAEMHLLESINQNKGITELAQQAHRTKGAITQTTNKLDKKNLIDKKINETYHKEINLSTTDYGNKACA